MCGQQENGSHLREPFSEITTRVTTKTSMFEVGGCSQVLVHAALCAYCALKSVWMMMVLAWASAPPWLPADGSSSGSNYYYYHYMGRTGWGGAHVQS